MRFVLVMVMISTLAAGEGQAPPAIEDYIAVPAELALAPISFPPHNKLTGTGRRGWIRRMQISVFRWFGSK